MSKKVIDELEKRKMESYYPMQRYISAVVHKSLFNDQWYVKKWDTERWVQFLVQHKTPEYESNTHENNDHFTFKWVQRIISGNYSYIFTHWSSPINNMWSPTCQHFLSTHYVLFSTTAKQYEVASFWVSATQIKLAN